MIAEYVTDTVTEMVHLKAPFVATRTLCGRTLGDRAIEGDETESGLVATCKVCKFILRKGTKNP